MLRSLDSRHNVVLGYVTLSQINKSPHTTELVSSVILPLNTSGVLRLA